MKHNPEALRELQGLLTTLLRVRNEGKTLGMQAFFFEEKELELHGYQGCGTVCCVIGWHSLFHNGWEDLIWATSKSSHIAMLVSGETEMFKTYEEGRPADKCRSILFGGGRSTGLTNDEALARQIGAVRWFIRREEARRDYESLRAMPRKQRRALRIAA